MTTIKRMTRREALKNLGLLATGAFLLGSSDVLTSCSSDNGKKRIVFCPDGFKLFIVFAINTVVIQF